MTTGNKISKLRKENNYTQEQLAEKLGVSRQSISKWESGLAYPETDKLIQISSLFDCTLDYLLKDEIENPHATINGERPNESNIVEQVLYRIRHFEMKSKRTLFGMPLWHVACNAKGVFALGFKATGIFSLGLLSIGLFSFGLLSLGILSFGAISIGLFSAGSISAGVFSAGAISFGIITAGGIAIGEFSLGGLAIGKYIAIGDHASGMFAFGKTKVAGTVFEKLGNLTYEEKQQAIELMKLNIPSYFSWVRNIFSGML